MVRALIVLFCALFALIAGWSLLRAWRTGRISSRGWTFQREESPIGFWLVAIVDFGILAASLIFALHTLGLIGDLPTSLTIELPRSY
jgi:hypothetical protein